MYIFCCYRISPPSFYLLPLEICSDRWASYSSINWRSMSLYALGLFLSLHREDYLRRRPVEKPALLSETVIVKFDAEISAQWRIMRIPFWLYPIAFTISPTSSFLLLGLARSLTRTCIHLIILSARDRSLSTWYRGRKGKIQELLLNSFLKKEYRARDSNRGPLRGWLTP